MHFFCKHGDNVSSAFGDAAHAARDLAQELLDMQALLLPDCEAGGDLACPKDSSSASTDSTAQQLWTAMKQRLHESVVPKFDDLSEWWSARSRPARGMQRLKVINQSIAKQVEMVMANKEELVEKSRVTRSSNRMLGSEKAAATHTHSSIYDDGDFYQALLLDFIEASSSGSTDTKKRKTKRKRVDRRASKGRKLRFHVHPKLMNFAAPDPHGGARLDVKQLFSSILGKSIN